MLAFFVEEQFHHLGRGHHPEFPGVELARLAQDFTQDVVRDTAGGFDAAFALAHVTRLTQHVRQ